MRKVILPLIILSLLFGVMSFAKEIDLPNPGLTPDSPFYFLDTLGEKIEMLFTFGAEKKAEKALKFAEEKLAEIKIMAEKKETKALEKANKRYEKFLDLTNTKTTEAKEKGKDIEELAALITEKTLKHQEVLVEVLKKVPEETKDAIQRAIEVSIKGSETAVEAVSKEKKEELQQKIEEMKVKVETVDWKVYTNEKYGFEAKYPLEWVAGVGALPNNFVFGESGWTNTVKINITVYTESFIDKIYKEETKERICARVVLLAEEAYRCEGKDFIYLETEHNGKFYLWSAFGTRESEKFKIFDQMLPTFKFIESEIGEEEVCNVPEVPVLTDPGISVESEVFTVKWTGASGVTKYRLQRDTNSNFSAPLSIPDYWLNYEQNSMTGNPNPEVTTTYYYRIKACNDCGCSSWSNVVDMRVIVIPSITIIFPNGGELISQESCKIQWDSNNVKLIDILLLVYDENKSQLICYYNPIGTGFSVVSEVPIAAFKQGAKAEDGYYLASFKQELEENCSFVIPPAYYKIKLRESYLGETVDTSDGYFTISPAPNFKIISAGNEVILRGRINPLNWDGRTFITAAENNVILTDNSTKFYLDGEEITFEELKQIYDEMGENKYCPFGSCPYNSLNGNIWEVASQGKVTVMAKEMFFANPQ